MLSRKRLALEASNWLRMYRVKISVSSRESVPQSLLPDHDRAVTAAVTGLHGNGSLNRAPAPAAFGNRVLQKSDPFAAPPGAAEPGMHSNSSRFSDYFFRFRSS